MLTAILFAFVVNQETAVGSQWATGFSVSLGAICAIVLIALTLAIIFQRRPRQLAPADRGD